MPPLPPLLFQSLMVMICLREKLDKSELRKLVKAVDKSLIWKLSRENLNSSVWFTFDWHLIKKVSNGKVFTAFIWKWIIPIMRKRFEHRFWLWGLRSAFVFVKWAALSWVESGICMYLYLSRMGIKEIAPGLRGSGHHLGSRGKWWWGRGAAQRVPRYLVKTSVVPIYHLRIKRLHMNCVTWDRTVSETV